MGAAMRRPAGNGIRPSPRQEFFARALIWFYVLGTLASVVLWIMLRRNPERLVWFELIFTLTNVPVSGSLLSIVLLAITSRLLIGRKRAGLVIAAVFQGMAILGGLFVFGALAAYPEEIPIAEDLWSWHFLFGPGVDIVASLIGIPLLWACWWARRSFRGGCAADPGWPWAPAWRPARCSRSPSPGSACG